MSTNENLMQMYYAMQADALRRTRSKKSSFWASAVPSTVPVSLSMPSVNCLASRWKASPPRRLMCA